MIMWDIRPERCLRIILLSNYQKMKWKLDRESDSVRIIWMIKPKVRCFESCGSSLSRAYDRPGPGMNRETYQRSRL